MHLCGVCGTEFDPSGYQLVVNGRSYHSVDCAVRALEHATHASEPVGVDPARAEQVGSEPSRARGDDSRIESTGRVYSLSGAVVLPDERRSSRRLAVS